MEDVSRVVTQSSDLSRIDSREQILACKR